MKYHQLEKDIFDEWRKRSVDYDHGDNFAEDGLLYKGDINYSDTGYWYRNTGNEEELWKNAHTRVLFLTKDLNDTDAWDIRAETGRKNHSGETNIIINTPFYKNYMRWFYGILTACQTGECKSYEEANCQQTYRSFFDEMPLVRVNCKKQVGGGTISTDRLKHFMERYKDLLVKQIKLYNPDVIVCCGGSSSIKDFIATSYLPDLERINKWVYYSNSLNKVVIDFYHLSHRFSQEGVYTDLMNGLKEFIDKYPTFVQPKR